MRFAEWRKAAYKRMVGFFTYHGVAKKKFGSYRKHNTWNFLKLKSNLRINDKIRVAQSAGSKPGTLGAFSGKIASFWHSVLADLHEG